MGKPRQGKSTGRRRPNAPEGAARTEVVKISLSPFEKKRVEVAARRVGVSVPHYYELCAWSGDGQAASELRDLRVDLHTTWRGLATALNNINQMAHYANTEQLLHADTDAVRAQLVEQMDELQAIMARIPSEGD